MAVEFGKWEEIKRNPTIPFTQEKGVLIKGWWSADKEGKNVITNASLEDTVYFHIEMMGASIQDGDKLSLQLYEYDTFIWVDSFNLDDKIENPKECIIKDAKALLEVFLKPDWNKHIEEDTGYEIELYWEVKYSKKDITINLPDKSENYLNIRNDRNVFIKPVMEKTGYNYGIPEIYDYKGNPMFFTIIEDIQEKEKIRIGEDYVKSFLISSMIYTANEKLPSISKGIAMTKLDAGYRVSHSGKMMYHQYLKNFSTSNVTVKDKLVKHLIPDYWYETRGLDHVATMQKKLISTNTLYFVKNWANMFGSLNSLVELRKGGEDINSLLSDALVLATNANPILGILTKMTLDVLATPVKEFMEDWKDDHIRAINAKKMEGLNKLIYFLDYGNRTQPMFPKEYKILHIDYQSMQGLLDGSIRRSKDIKSSYNEIAMLYIDKGYNIIIDSFFINR